ncbi:hypothetical protein CGC48_05185 [Capnocytophaga cynodegmi]|uniref:Uncharacterized protein n=1 Tax=Capnocytophaga cynodegmi TaxID=28189 RepID=A0A250E8K2_9FLAO|nr:hypothetical protein [Capnocytophaga cynodegmi]ATA68075.1 hypothetical protein CGC48_05185 [Capnocytophaga cynodegmi]
MVDYTRKITHTGYKKPDVVKKYFHRVPKMIYEAPPAFNKGYGKTYLVEENFIVKTDLWTSPWAIGITVGVISLGTLLLFAKGMLRGVPLRAEDMIFFIGAIIGFLFSIIYPLTMPKEEAILNRRDGLITFDGFLWQPNITMAFSEVEFCYSTGGTDLQGAFQLQVMRPNKWVTFAIPIYPGKCYESISFIVWYMDKNRPLPPGELFDPYREADYHRRKAEGFPPPLYPSKIETPEATPEQQAERKRIGKW